MHLIFLGAPGSGKGTQSERLKKTHGYSHISTGDLLRAEVSSGTELGGRIKNIIDNGSLVDDMTVLELFKNNLQLDEKNYILDGFPRTINQCEMLSSEVFGDIAHKAIYFEIDERKVVERIVNRRVAPQSGEIYNLVTNPPKVDGVCDVSGEKLVHRDDDKEEVILNRLRVYRDSINSMLEFYRKNDRLVTVDASVDPDKLYDELIKVLG